MRSLGRGPARVSGQDGGTRRPLDAGWPAGIQRDTGRPACVEGPPVALR
ncbi:hypothetical protein M2161_008775 [Streptomyces sp. SAI-133]|nr:hypothetical protein [Streptomyces sp. SAI-133]